MATSWEVRRPVLLQQLKQLNPDILIVQELCPEVIKCILEALPTHDYVGGASDSRASDSGASDTTNGGAVDVTQGNSELSSQEGEGGQITEDKTVCEGEAGEEKDLRESVAGGGGVESVGGLFNGWQHES